jgi:hypothetical protein
VNILLIDWFNEIYRDRYSSLRFPERGYYIFNTEYEEAVMQIQFCPFCGKSLGSRSKMNNQTNKTINPKPYNYNCGTRIYWNTLENA